MSFVYGLIIFLLSFLIVISLSLVAYIIFSPQSNKVDIREIECDCEDEEKRWLKMLNTAVTNVGKTCQLSSKTEQTKNLPMPIPNQLTVPNQAPVVAERPSVVIGPKKALNTVLPSDRLSNEAFFDNLK